MNTITINGKNIRINMESSGRDLKPGDLYVARRNSPEWILMHCKYVNLERGWVIPIENQYLFDLHECHKAEEIV